jgi:hypothetical protein
VLGSQADADTFVESVRSILAQAPLRRTQRSVLTRDDYDPPAFAELLGLLLTTRAYHDWLMRNGRAEAAPLMKEIAEWRVKLRRARARQRQAKHAGSSDKAWHRALRDALIARGTLEAKLGHLHVLRSGLPEPPVRHRVRLEHAAAIGILHQLYYDFGLPDRTIEALLKACGLPALTARTIKRLRTTYRRP